MRSKILIAATVALLLLAALFGSFGVQSPATAAPRAAATPVTAALAPSGFEPVLATLWDSQVITQDTRACMNTMRHEKLDIHWNINQGPVNTTTLTLQYTNDTPGAAGATYVSGVNAVASNTTDTGNMAQLQTFGAWSCILADVTTATGITVTVKALAK